VYVVGIDAMTLDIIQPMVDSGELPAFASMMEKGAHGRVATTRPNHSGLIWTTIASGVSHKVHGIDGERVFRVLGGRMSTFRVHQLNKLGLKAPLRLLQALGLMKAHMYDSRDVKAPRIWEIISDAGGCAGVVNWPNSWPAGDLNGFVVSDRVQHWRREAAGYELAPADGLTFPPGLADEICAVLLAPDDVCADDIKRYVDVPDEEIDEFLTGEFIKKDLRAELRYAIASDTSAWRSFRHCLERWPQVDLAILHFWSLDKIQHAAYRFVPFIGHPDSKSPESARLGGAVLESYRFLDRAVGEILARMKPADTLVVVSDHGFAWEEERGDYGHKRSEPPGVLLATGSRIRSGVRLDSATVYDMAPTILRLCGIEPPARMEGRCLDEIFAREEAPQAG
jgi:predicted AlkP superfamily phosphohydrolase/phosphomutase